MYYGNAGQKYGLIWIHKIMGCDNCCTCEDNDIESSVNGGPKVCSPWIVFDTKLFFVLTRWMINHMYYGNAGQKYGLIWIHKIMGCDNCCTCEDNDIESSVNGGPKVCSPWIVFDTKLFFVLTRWMINHMYYGNAGRSSSMAIFDKLACCKYFVIGMSPIALPCLLACDLVLFSVYISLFFPVMILYAMFSLPHMCCGKMPNWQVWLKVGLSIVWNSTFYVLITMLLTGAASAYGLFMSYTNFAEYSQKIRDSRDEWFCLRSGPDEEQPDDSSTAYSAMQSGQAAVA
eukprot:TRINITY_DN12037_c0_g1_i1.p1 TRINITY_DN12037_c0_g1~~TRINITY_DN12037_c0_g1_i1.p1  ORF type:complete len:287 (-),score=22.56 TRINITY_DN12037_c0_g1_i1:74-934(-)